MQHVRPTLKLLRLLPRDSFPDPSTYDKVASLSSASHEAREQIISSLRLHRLEHALLDDARSYFNEGCLPEQHVASSQARTTKNGKAKPVYEVRSRTGAAWRGGVIIEEGSPWLAYADRHNEFHASAPKIFSNVDRYWPSSIDIKMRDREAVDVKNDEIDIECLIVMIETLALAVRTAPEIQRATVKGRNDQSSTVTFNVDLGEPAKEPNSAHSSLSTISLEIRLDAKNHTLRDQMIRLYVPFIQPDPTMREQAYSEDYSTMILHLLVTQAQLAQVLVTTSSGNGPRPVEIPEPSVQHFFGLKKLAEAFVFGDPRRALCGTWIVPTREGDSIKHLPICSECEKLEPVVQNLLDLARKE